jgi:hypothetical protein
MTIDKFSACDRPMKSPQPQAIRLWHFEPRPVSVGTAIRSDKICQ